MEAILIDKYGFRTTMEVPEPPLPRMEMAVASVTPVVWNNVSAELTAGDTQFTKRIFYLKKLAYSGTAAIYVEEGGQLPMEYLADPKTQSTAYQKYLAQQQQYQAMMNQQQYQWKLQEAQHWQDMQQLQYSNSTASYPPMKKVLESAMGPLKPAEIKKPEPKIPIDETTGERKMVIDE